MEVLDNKRIESDGSIQKDENSMEAILQELYSIFSIEYKELELFIHGERRQCFVMNNGTVFEIIGLLPFECVTVSYADNLSEAKKDFFEEGDQFYAWQDINSLVKEIREELKMEEKETER